MMNSIINGDVVVFLPGGRKSGIVRRGEFTARVNAVAWCGNGNKNDII